MSTIRVLVKSPNLPVRQTNIKNDLRTKQKIVEGFIEAIPSGIDNIDIIINEEGKLFGLEPNFIYMGCDIIVGTAIFARANWETGEYVSLADKDIQDIMEMYFQK